MDASSPWVERLLAGEPAPALGAADRLALAWDLKHACYASWTSEPSRAVRCAECVAALAAEAAGEAPPLAPPGAQPTAPPPDAHTPRHALNALAHWTQAIAHLTQGRMEAALGAIAEAAATFRAIGQREHAAQAELPQLMALTLLGRHADAAEAGARLRDEFLQLGDHGSAAKVVLNLGNLHLRRDDHRAAARHYREAAVRFARAGDAQHSVMADIGLVDALSSLGELDEAQRIGARARMRAESHGLPVLQALSEESVALLNLARGRCRDALQGLESSRRRYEQLDMPQHLAIAEKQLGDAYLELRLLPEALALLSAALTKMQALDMPDDAAWTQLQVARAQGLLGQGDAARATLQAAARGFAEQDNAVGAAEAAVLQAECALPDGALDEALAGAESAARQLSAQGHALAAVRAEVVAAELLLALGRRPEARQRLSACLDRARALQLLLVEVQCLDALGRCALADGDAARATGCFEDAVERFEQQRGALPGDDLRSAFLANHLSPYAGLLRLALDHDDACAPQAKAAAVLQRLEQFRARALGERLLQSVRPSADESTRDQRARLGWLYRRAHARGDGGPPSPALLAEVQRAEQDLLEANRRARLMPSASPSASSGAAGAGAHSAAAAAAHALGLPHRLQSDERLVEYGVLDDELFACVVGPQGVHLQRRLAPWREVRRAIQAVRFQLDTLRHGAAPLSRHLDRLHQRVLRPLTELHAMVWAPLGLTRPGVQRVLVVPDGPLGALPFAALHDGQRHLVEHTDLAFAHSAQLAAHGLGQAAVAPRQALVLADTHALAHAGAEADAVARAFPGARLLLGEEASAAALHAATAVATATASGGAGARGPIDLLHLACHARFRQDSPMFSALQLADGPLTAEAIEAMPLGARLVVLSACETGLAGALGGDELVGLVRAFMLAGAERVVASLWPVDDAVSAGLMYHFYQSVAAGHGLAPALRQAQCAVMRAHPHPFFWAAHTVHGGW